MVRILTQILLGLAVATVGFVLAIGLHLRAAILDADAACARQVLTPSQVLALHTAEPLRNRCSRAIVDALSARPFPGYLLNGLHFWAAYPVVCYGTPDEVLDRAYFAHSYMRGWGKPGLVYDTIAPRVISDLSDAEFTCLLRSTRNGRTVCGPDERSRESRVVLAPARSAKDEKRHRVQPLIRRPANQRYEVQLACGCRAGLDRETAVLR